jgi:hypothetical protein
MVVTAILSEGSQTQIRKEIEAMKGKAEERVLPRK